MAAGGLGADGSRISERLTRNSRPAGVRKRLRDELQSQLGIPPERIALDPEPRGQIELDDITIEKWVFTSEPGSCVPALLYRPKNLRGGMPAIVLTYGHGGSKSTVGSIE